MQNVGQTVISQYANSPVINALINSWNAALDPAVNFESFYGQVWNLQTASGWGLDNWGKILGISRYVQLPNIGNYVGFNNPENDWLPMSQGPFYSGGSLNTAYALSDAAYRTLLLAKALANISRTSIQLLNSVVQTVFGTGAMCVADLGSIGTSGMAMAYVFATTPTTVNLAIAENSGVLPHPTGVNTAVYTALLYNAVLTAAASSTNTGYSTGSYGTLTPSTDLNGHTIAQAYTSSSTNAFYLTINSGTTLSSTYLNYVVVGGMVFKGSLATFTANYPSAGQYNWEWASIPQLVAGTSNSLLIF
jgi:hypothetical protein